MRKLFLIALFIISNLATAFAAGRYVSLAPATTEILFALGLDNEIVGVSSYCDYPEAAKTKEKIGNFSQPNIEKIVSLKPDIIFATGLEQAMAVSQLRQLGFKVYVSDPENFRELFTSIMEIGRLTGKENEAKDIIDKMETDIKEITSEAKLIPREKRPKVFVAIWHDPPMTVGSMSFIDELITLAGGVNIAGDIKKAYVYFSSEEVIRRNPDCIILGYMDKTPIDNFRQRLGWERIQAVKNNRVYSDIEPGLLMRPCPRLIEGLKKMHLKLYPKE